MNRTPLQKLLQIAPKDSELAILEQLQLLGDVDMAEDVCWAIYENLKRNTVIWFSEKRMQEVHNRLLRILKEKRELEEMRNNTRLKKIWRRLNRVYSHIPCLNTRRSGR